MVAAAISEGAPPSSWQKGNTPRIGMHQNRQHLCREVSKCAHLCLFQSFSQSLKSLGHTCQLPTDPLWHLTFSFQVCSYWGHSMLVCLDACQMVAKLS